jgi:TonB family protein
MAHVFTLPLVLAPPALLALIGAALAGVSRQCRCKTRRKRHRIVPALLVVAVIAAPGFAARASAQAPDARQGELVLIWLPRPEYPFIARATRLQGLVEVVVDVASDGTVVSATMRSGHALFRDAVLEAARETYFMTRSSGAPVLPYVLTYTFALGDSGPRAADTSSTVTGTGARITTVTGVDFISCGPAPLAVPGPKCLYLWRCGRDWDWYMEQASVRGPKCLWLWGCAARTD